MWKIINKYSKSPAKNYKGQIIKVKSKNYALNVKNSLNKRNNGILAKNRKDYEVKKVAVRRKR